MTSVAQRPFSMASVGSINSNRELYLAETARIRAAFEATSDGLAAVRARSDLVDQVVVKCAEPLFRVPKKIALVALGGYGRQALFPYSDVDLLFLCANEGVKQSSKDGIRRTSQELWDLRLKLSPTTRTPNEGEKVDPENVEFTIALLDARFIGGDEEVFRRLKNEILQTTLRREWQSLMQLLVERTQKRHEKYGKTIFHLEPNIKEAPGGLRDHHVHDWLKTLLSVEQGNKDDEPDELSRAVEFLSATRTFLHYSAGRDDNTLSWEAQDRAASSGIGMESKPGLIATAWMRSYFRHARTIERGLLKLLQDVPVQRPSIYRNFQRWRTRVSAGNLSVLDGRVYFQNPSDAKNGEHVLRAFELMSIHGAELSADAESRIVRSLREIVESLPSEDTIRSSLCSTLKAPHAAQALRSMHAVGLLGHVVPEFRLLDALVVRDFYHRYTVDEHTFTAIDNLHRLPQRQNEWEIHLSELLQQVESPEILHIALLMHDLGKGLPTPEHTQGSVELARSSLARLGFDEQFKEEVLYLVGSHLEMSAAMRRDIFDPENVRAFSAKVGTLERLRLLCLMTYADIRAVNPEALTPWKAENLWRLYTAASNQLNRGVDDDLFHATAGNEQIKKLEKLIPNRSRQLQAFLEGLPRRYLLSHSTDQIALHFDLSLRTGREPAAVALKLGGDLYELSVVSEDRPFLFARIAGALAAWGMNIVKGNAFSNAAGLAVDSFFFKDKFRTLELNPSERDRFKRSVADVVSGRAELDQLMERRGGERANAGKIAVATGVMIDNEASSHSSVTEVIAQDRTGLLYTIASAISEQGCNIELALIDTEGQAAIDVFYVTRNKKKLSGSTAKALKQALLEELG
jgi:[protein-PII] uridylyltransferase